MCVAMALTKSGGDRYKARGAYEAILPFLDRCHAEQVAKGIVSEDEKKNNFPY